jgi:O-antigen/teichoic acid export membrane protein
MIKNVSRNRELFAEYWGNTLFVTTVSSVALAGLLLLIAPFVLPPTISPLLLLLAAIADLYFLRVLDATGQAFGAVLWLSKTAWLNILPVITRVGAALALVQWFPQPTVIEWMGLYLCSTAVSALVGVVMVNRNLGLPKLALWRIKPELREGCYFSIGLSAQTIYNDIDKTMLARLASLEVTGTYAAAYRLIDVAFSPVRSLQAAAYANFFKKGASGISGCVTLAKRLVPLAGVYSLAASLGLMILAPVIPRILGQEYAASVDALRWLAPLLVFKAMHSFAADALAGSGFQGIRSAIQIVVAGFNILINLWLISRYSWQGAAWSSLASDSLLMLGLGAIVILIYQQQQTRLAGNKIIH